MQKLCFALVSFGLLSCGLLLPASAEAHPVISEVFWMGSDLSTFDEWLEVTGVDDVTDMSGYKLTSVNSSGNEVTIFQFPAGSVLDPGEVWVISHFTAGQSRLVSEPTFVSSSITLPNTKLLLRIRNTSDEVVDTADDGIGNPMAGTNQSNPPVKASMERIDLSIQGGLNTNWRTTNVSNNLEEPTINFGTPGISSFSSSSSVAASSSSSSSVAESSSSAMSSVMSSSSESISFSSSSESSYSEHSTSSFSSTSSESSDSSETSEFSNSSTSSTPSPCPSLSISELLPDPTGDDSAEWIEFINTGQESIHLFECAYSIAIGTTKKAPVFSDDVLQPKEVIVLNYSKIGAHLPNGGSTVMLSFNNEAIDTFVYPQAMENISFVRDGIDVVLGCVPSPGTTEELAWNPEIQLETGSLSGVGKTAVNIKMIGGNGSLEDATCEVDFGDEHVSKSCNPPSHTYNEVGDFILTTTVKNVCGTTVIRTMNVNVYPAISSSSVSSQTSSALSFLSSVSSSSSSQAQSTLMSILNTKIVLSAALPNPQGPDSGREWIEVRNAGSVAGLLDGYVLQTPKATSKALSGIIDPGEVRKIMTADIGLTLRNENESVTLVRSDGSSARTISWKKASDGVSYRPVSDAASVHLLVTHVIDGDTFAGTITDAGDMMSGEEVTVRLLGVDAPETVHPKKKVEFYGKESSNYLRSLIDNKNIELQFDTDRSDIYGRWLGYVRINGALIEEEMLKNGYAKVEEPYTFSQKSLFLDWQKEAQEKKRGMWSKGDGKESEDLEDLDLLKNSISYNSIDKIRTKILINEVHASINKNSTDTFLKNEWIEVFNPLDEQQDLTGLVLKKTEKKTKFYAFASGSVIQPHSYMVIFSQNYGLKLNDGGSEIYLESPDGVPIDSVKYSKLKGGESYMRIDDDWCVTIETTPGRENVCRQKKNTNKKVVQKEVKSSLLAYMSPLESKITYQTVIPELDTVEASGGALWEPLRGMVMGEEGEVSKQVAGKDFAWNMTLIFSVLSAFFGILLSRFFPILLKYIK